MRWKIEPLWKISILFILFAIVSVPIHEWGHWLAVSFVGGSGNVTYSAFGLEGKTHFTGVYNYDWFVSLNGGLTVFIVYGIWSGLRLYSRMLLSAIVIGWIAAFHLLYGISEIWLEL